VSKPKGNQCWGVWVERRQKETKTGMLLQSAEGSFKSKNRAKE